MVVDNTGQLVRETQTLDRRPNLVTNGVRFARAPRATLHEFPGTNSASSLPAGRLSVTIPVSLPGGPCFPRFGRLGGQD